MASTIIHDLKQPMSVIRGFAELLGESKVDSDKRQTFSKLIIADVDRFLEMTKELLDFSRGTVSVEPIDVQLGGWLDSLVANELDGLAGLGIQLETQFGYQGTANFDPNRLRRAVRNMVANAVDAMPTGGRLSITTYSVGTGNEDSHWELVLEDTGTGIPAEMRPKIMEPFVSFGKEHGTGLGLPVVRNIVESHGGEIEFESRVAGESLGRGSGTKFTVRLPVRRLSAKAARPNLA